MYRIIYYWRRALGNLRREPLLSGATVLTLAVAFLCFCSFLAVALGLDRLVGQWADDYHISVFLGDGVSEDEARRIADRLDEVPQVERASVVTSAEMRERMVAGLDDDDALGDLDARLFPLTIELRIGGDVNDPALVAALAERLDALAAVEQVETYGDLFARLRTVSTVARAVSVVLGVIVLLATLLVVSNTVRLSLLGRREEIEIMKLCGATDRFVRAPFVLTGALQGMVGALLSLGMLALAGAVLQRAVGGFLPPFMGHDLVGLPIAASAAVIACGTVLGLAGSHLSVTSFLKGAP
jgi:cell division transport system permease protein